jgi:haloalkane dehalogenase
MDILRTPDERFEGLPDWPYAPRYTVVAGELRVHYVDEGSRDGPTVLLAHGEPTWSYLYRRMIPRLVDAGCRVVAPDLIGFGRSDKPTSRDSYSYRAHVEWFTEFVENLDLREITLFCQDWGGLISLIHAARHPQRYRGVVASNTVVPAGIDVPFPADHLFPRWIEYSQKLDPFSASEIVAGNSPINQIDYRLSEAERRAYDAPFPDEAYCAGARQFPLLIPMTEDHPDAAMCREIWAGPLPAFDKPTVTVFGSRDTATLDAAAGLAASITGAAGQPHRIIDGAAHFIQEHAPDACVDAILEHLDRTR